MSAPRASAASQSLTTEFSSPPTYWMGLRTSGSSGSSRSNTDSPPMPSAYRDRTQPTQVLAVGLAASRSALIRAPQTWRMPCLRPPSLARAASISARSCRAASASAATCCRSNASVAPSGSCSSSAPTSRAAATSPPNSRSSGASRARARSRAAARATRASSCSDMGSSPRDIFAARSGEPGFARTAGIGQAGAMADELTLMAVHAHPDDEASSTGGVLATYSGQGIRTVVVTCTNGEFGDAPGGVKPGQDGHDEQTVAQLRLAELREAAKILGVSDLEMLGYHDSGMPDWDYKDRPEAFCNVPLEEVTGRVGALIEQYRPQVVVTYDDQGPYQHPDHLHASRSAQAAFRDSGTVAKLYLSAMRGSDWRKIWEALRELGAEVPDFEDMDSERQRQALASEQRITTTVDIRQ